MTGIYAIYKPKGPTSNQVLKEIKKITGEKKVGHAGTLDPLATGVLIVGIGREATRNLTEIVGQEKEYNATIKLGITSTTDDAEGEKEITKVENFPTLKEVECALAEFIGQIKQTPPIFSAVKIQGQEAYKRARRGEHLTLEPRPVEIKSIKIIQYDYPILKLNIVCGKGTYIRSLARDIGRKLKTGGYIEELERVRIGNFSKDTAMELDKFSQIFRKGDSEYRTKIEKPDCADENQNTTENQRK